ncbi:hypothetical protein MMC21_002144 [Puttea exsequens]|nr:hypothetical protein [Puttea exsequens]
MASNSAAPGGFYSDELEAVRSDMKLLMKEADRLKAENVRLEAETRTTLQEHLTAAEARARVVDLLERMKSEETTGAAADTPQARREVGAVRPKASTAAEEDRRSLRSLRDERVRRT